jgi:hypothetical protein
MEKDKDLLFEEKLAKFSDENNEIDVKTFFNILKEDIQEESDRLDEELAKEFENVTDIEKYLEDIKSEE